MNILSLGDCCWVSKMENHGSIQFAHGLQKQRPARANYNALSEVLIFRFSEFLASQKGAKSVNT